MLEDDANFETYFNLLYTCYSVPNIVLPLFGGKLVDRFGPLSTMAFALIVLLGQVVFTFGVAERNWYIMLAGRTIYGIGGENLGVSNSALLAKWFVGSELGLSFGVTMAVGRLGSVINNFASPAIASQWNTVTACWVGCALNFCSLIMSICLYKFERYTVKKKEQFVKSIETSSHTELTASLLEDMNVYDDDVSLPDDMRYDDTGNTSIHTEIQGLKSGTKSSTASISNDESVSDTYSQSGSTTGSVRLSDVKNFGVLFWLLSISCFVVYGCILPFNNIASALLLERDYFKTPSDDCTLRFENQCTGGYLAPPMGNPSTDSNGDSCPGSHYAHVLPTSLNYTQNNYDDWDSSWEKDEYVFDDIDSTDVNCEDDFWAEACTKDYCDAKDDAVVKAGQVMSIPYMLSAGLAPFLGGFADKYGGRTVLTIISPVILILVHVFLGFSDMTPITPLIFQGIAYAIFASVLWPSVPLVEPNFTGTAYGVMTAIQNVGLAFFPIIIAMLHTYGGHEYIPNCEIFFTSLAGLGLIFGIVLHKKDKKKGGMLNRATSEVTGDNLESSDNAMPSVVGSHSTNFEF